MDDWTFNSDGWDLTSGTGEATACAVFSWPVPEPEPEPMEVTAWGDGPPVPKKWHGSPDFWKRYLPAPARIVKVRPPTVRLAVEPTWTHRRNAGSRRQRWRYQR